MKKLIKWLGVFAVIGTVVGLAAAYFCRKDSDSPDESETDFTEDEDFDLDADLQPAGREYVSLKKGKDDSEPSEEDTPARESEEPAEQEAETAKADSDEN